MAEKGEGKVEETSGMETREAPRSTGEGKAPGGDVTTKTAMISPPVVAASFAIVLLAVLFRTGWMNVLLVLLCSILLLLNPWVRTFLELPATRGAAQATDTDAKFSPYDPARFLNFTPKSALAEPQGPTLPGKEGRVPSASSKRNLGQIESYAALRRMPQSLRTPIADLEELIIRDFISTWYNFHSFGDQCLQNEARFSIDHAVGSAYAAMEHTRSADVVSELLLTVSSVLLTTLRTRRLYPGRPAIFSSNAERIASLKEALSRLLSRHFKSQDSRCDLLKTLLREILSKQIWNAVCGIGEPDFINRKIVEWGENQRAKELAEQQAHAPWPREAKLNTPWQDTSRRSSGAPSPAPPSQMDPDFSALNMAASASNDQSPTLSRLQAISNSAAPLSKSASLTTPARTTGALHSEPLTMQPRAMAMPSPNLMSRSPAPGHDAFQPNAPSPSTSVPALPRRPQIDTRIISGQADPSHQRNRDSAQRSPQPQPPQLPPRKEAKAAEAPKGEDVPWLFMPMDLPPEAHQGMLLPESLQKSMRRVSSEESGDDVEGYRISSDSHRSNTQRDGSNPGGSYQTLGVRESGSHDHPGQGSNDSQAYRVRSRPSSRPASSASGGIPPAPDLAEVLSSTNSAGLTALRDAFEAFLDRGGATSRSLFFSPPSSATVAQGEGLALLKLHVGLATLARLIPGNEIGDEGEVYREDAYNVAVKALRNLRQVDDSYAGRPLREALLVAAQRLEVADDGRVREVMRPVENSLWARLQGLYDHFWKETCTRPAGSRPPVASPSLSGNGTGNGRQSFSTKRETEDRAKPKPSVDQLHYQPRRKASAQANASAPMSLNNSQVSAGAEMARPGSVPPHSPRDVQRSLDSVQTTPSPPKDRKGEQGQPPAVPPRKEGVARPTPRRAEPRPISSDGVEGSETGADKDLVQEPESLSSIEISVTDVSPNADRPTALVDLRTYEIMIAVEGLVAGGGGFVLLRTWRDLQQLDEQLRASVDTTQFGLRLPSTKGKTSLLLTRNVEDFLVRLLSTPSLVETEAVQYFVDKTRAGEAPSDRSSVLRDSLRLSNRGLGIGKSLASGVGAVGKNAFNTLQMMPGSVAAMRGSLNIGTNSPEKRDRLALAGDGALRPSRGAGGEDESVIVKEEDETAAIKRSPMARAATDIEPSPQPSASRGGGLHHHQQQHQQQQHNLNSNTNLMEISPQELDNLLSCFFAIADEAFNLSGGWTLRRGMLRVLEQVVRTQYWTSLMGMFQNLSVSLNQDQIGAWLVHVTDMFWPDDAKAKADYTSNNNTASGEKLAKEGRDEKVNVKREEEDSKEERRAEVAAEVLVEALGGTTTTTTRDGLDSQQAAEEPRSKEEKLACHLKAKAIIISQTPVGSAAYFLGPGGRQSCEKALNLLHEEICDPETSLDIVLAVVLKVCDIVAR